jgi:pimeloyl-ACP methyl ester carboxylesterase
LPSLAHAARAADDDGDAVREVEEEGSHAGREYNRAIPLRSLSLLLLALVCTSCASDASIDGININSASTGSGKATIVLVHGWTCDSSSWDAQVPALAKRYRVITLDLPGHGRSGAPRNGKFSLDMFASAIEMVRAEARVDRIVLIGHSMGAPIIRQYARHYPDHVAGLVAVDGPLDMRHFGEGFTPPSFAGPGGLKKRESMIREMFGPQTSPALQQRILTMMLSVPEGTATPAFKSIFDPALRTSDVIPMPALIIWAGTNTEVPSVEEARQVLPRYSQTQLAGTGHFLMMEKPDEFNELVTSFVDGLTF